MKSLIIKLLFNQNLTRMNDIITSSSISTLSGETAGNNDGNM